MRFQLFRLSKFALAALMLLSASAYVGIPASAQVLDQIKKTKVVRVGILQDNAPFGFNDKNNQPVGFNVDIANLVAAELGAKLEVVPTTNASRIAMLTTGGIDISIATIGMLPDRAKVIQFSEPYTQFENVIVGAKTLAVSEFKDLKGLRIGVGQGASSEAAMLATAPKYGATVQSFADRAANMQALISGQIDVIADDALVLKVLEGTAPGKYERKFPYSKLWMGIAMPKGQMDLLKAVNGAVNKIRSNGELAALHAKWLGWSVPEWPKEVEGVPITVEQAEAKK